MRAFFAIDVPENIAAGVDQLAQRLQSCGARASWVPPQRMHLTIRFLGEISDAQCAGLLDAVERPLSNLPPLRVALSGVGFFGRRKRPETVWVGVQMLSGDIDSLVAVLDQAAHAQGRSTDTKPFRPHITLARIRDPRTADDLVAALDHESDFVAGEFTCHNVVLYSSSLTPQGPNYSRIKEFPLHAP